MFPRHPKGSAAIEALAEGLRDDCAELDRLAGSVADPPWADDPAVSVRRHTDQIMGRVLELAESIEDYGDAVADFDERVDRLNARWDAERRSRFGVPPPWVGETATPADVAAADQQDADLVWHARVDVAQALRAEYERARAELVAAGTAFDRATGYRLG
jgi:hypothetical protein